MPSIQLHREGDGCWPDLKLDDCLQADSDSLQIALLSEGMESGLPSVVMRVETTEGQTVLIQTSWRALRAAALGIQARVGNFDGAPEIRGDA
jgi:hypothetical protein